MKKVILLSTVFIFSSVISEAQPGQLDSSFGTNGSVQTNFESLPGLTTYNSSAIQVDGKLVVTGSTRVDDADNNYSLVLARYNIDGSLDKSFSQDGKVTADSSTAVAMAIQKDGKILVAGSGIARYNVDGSIDSAFANDGKITEISVYFSSIAIQLDGKIVVAGTTGNSITYSQNFFVARYNTDGSPDNNFSKDGKVQTDIYNNDDAKSIVIQNDGKIVVVGNSQSIEERESFYYISLVRYNTDGELDNLFNGTGIVKYQYSGESRQDANSAALQNDGKIVVGGSLSREGQNVAVFRFKSDGNIDNAFGNSGLAETNLLGFVGVAPLIIQSDGKIVVAGTTHNGLFGLVRYNTDGTPDNSFSEDGMQETQISQYTNVIASLAISNNILYATGYEEYYLFYGGVTGVVAAYQLTGEVDSSYGFNGVIETNFRSGRGVNNIFQHRNSS